MARGEASRSNVDPGAPSERAPEIVGGERGEDAARLRRAGGIGGSRRDSAGGASIAATDESGSRVSHTQKQRTQTLIRPFAAVSPPVKSVNGRVHAGQTSDDARPSWRAACHSWFMNRRGATCRRTGSVTAPARQARQSHTSPWRPCVRRRARLHAGHRNDSNRRAIVGDPNRPQCTRRPRGLGAHGGRDRSSGGVRHGPRVVRTRGSGLARGRDRRGRSRIPVHAARRRCRPAPTGSRAVRDRRRRCSDP